MQYTMYYEEQQKIDYDEYGRLKQQLLQKEENQKNTLDKSKECGYNEPITSPDAAVQLQISKI